MIVDVGEARIIYHLIEIESEYNPIVLVESEVKHEILYKNIENRELEAIFSKLLFCYSLSKLKVTKKGKNG